MNNRARKGRGRCSAAVAESKWQADDVTAGPIGAGPNRQCLRNGLHSDSEGLQPDTEGSMCVFE